MTGQHHSLPVLVVGAGIGGITASLELAERGHRVLLCDRSPQTGGTLLQLDRWFPDDCCNMCAVLPMFARSGTSEYCLRRGLQHPNITIMSGTTVKSAKGTAGRFAVTLNRSAAAVSADRCTGCGRCAEVCPVEVPDRFNAGFSKRKAVYLHNPFAAEKIYSIDTDCCTRCGECVESCPADAIDFSASEECPEIETSAIILSTGFAEFDAAGASAYGYGRFPNVVVSSEVERLLSAGGPTGGRLLRPSDGSPPSSVAFVQCVGSRTRERDFCSSACCMYALKEALMVREQIPEAAVHVYGMDMRVFAKGCYGYYRKALEAGVQFFRCRPPRLIQNFKDNSLTLYAPDEAGHPVSRSYDMAVLSVGQSPPERFSALADTMGLETDRFGFIKTPPWQPVRTGRDGMYVCGSAAGPVDIPETIAGAGAAAAAASLHVSAPEDDTAAASASQAEKEMRIGVFLCTCDRQLCSAVDYDGLAAYCGADKRVHAVQVADHLCRPGAGRLSLPAAVKESGLTHLIVAGCSMLQARSVLDDFDAECEHVNIREQAAWVHGSGENGAAKIKSLIAMAVERIWRRPDSTAAEPASIHRKAAVIGGGLAGMTAALAASELGKEVDLIEQAEKLGGNLQQLYSTLSGDDVQAHLASVRSAVESDPHITVWTQARCSDISGRTGTFDVVLQLADGSVSTRTAGAVIIATGAQEAVPRGYMYGEHTGVLTQRELEQRLADSAGPPSWSCAVMIQCVGSMDAERPYCSRVCCSQALKNACELKRRNPDMDVVVLYRELMSYGLMESYYTAARRQGVLFVRYDSGSPPEVTADSDKLTVSVQDTCLGGRLEISPDVLVLSTGIAPGNNRLLSDSLEISLTDSGFFAETEPKFRPVDLLPDGVFVCGLAHSPRTMTETVIQAQAAAGRACLFLDRSGVQTSDDVAVVTKQWCSGCELCLQACPYGARIVDPQTGTAVVIGAQCRGCGACVAVCPNKASSLRRSSARQVLAVLDAALGVK